MNIACRYYKWFLFEIEINAVLLNLKMSRNAKKKKNVFYIFLPDLT